MTTTAKTGGQWNTVKTALRAQPDLDSTGLVHRPHQRKGAALARQQFTNLAVEHTGHIDHQTGHTIHIDGLCRLSQVDRQLAEFLVHGASARHIGRQFGRAKIRNRAPAGEIKGLHVQRCQKSGTVGVLPSPDVPVFHMPHQIRQSDLGQKEVPGQPGAGFLHVEMHHATPALETVQRVGSTLMMVQQHQLRRTCLHRLQQLGPE